jgi:hypothetical protein
MPLSRSWVDSEVTMLTGQDRAIARLALVLAKAPYQVDGTLVEDVLSEDRCEERFIRILAWASFSGAHRFAQRMAQATAALADGFGFDKGDDENVYKQLQYRNRNMSAFAFG